ncbi:MAG: PAS domain S-box protein [Chthoniobacter sp.]|nr:PAS domain S-box protein [Chthoniobacter sp.]
MPGPLQILIAEDNPADAKLLVRALHKAGFEFEHTVVDSEADYLRLLKPTLDIIISDFEMPQFGGLRALELLRERGLEIPFIIVSGTIGEDLAVEVMKRGATDYLLKDRLGRLGIAINQALEQGRLRRERRKTVEALRESEERFRQVVQNIEQVFWMTNLDKTEMLFVSAAYEKVWGRSCESLYASPMTWLDAIHPDDRGSVLEAANTRQVDGSYQEEYRIIRPDGSVRWISDRAFPVRDAGGNVYRIAGIAEDITVRRQAAADLKLFRNLVDQSNDTFEVIDPQTGRFLDVNEKGCADLGCSREEYLALRVSDIDPMVPASVWPSVAEKIRTNRSLNGEGLHRRKDGTTFPIEFSAKWVHLDRDYIVTVVRDISERKRAEEVLRESSLQKVERQKTGMIKDLVATCVGCVLLFGYFYFLDPIQAPVRQFATRHIDYLDDFVESAVIFLLGTMVFFYRRWREFQNQARQEAQVREALRTLHGELEVRVQQRTVELSKSNEALRGEIAERERAGEALRESERRFREMLENVELIAMTLDRRGTVTFCNDHLLKVTGWKREEVVGEDWFSKFLPGNPEVKRLFFDTVETGEIPAHHENPIQTRDGRQRYIDWNNTTLRDGAGAFLGTASIGEDVTERRQAEERVREQAAMLDLAHDAIIVRGFNDHKISFWNRGAESLYGWMASETAGRDVGEQIYVDPAGPDEIRDALLTKDEWRGETRHKTRSGKQLTVNTRATLVRDAEGVPKSVLTINTDITGQKELEARFLRAQRMESIGTLASGVAHDLNNILSPIMMSVPLLRRDLPGEAREDIISSIELCAERGAQIVKQVLTFGRGLEGERRPMQIASVIQEIMKILYETFPKDVQIDTDLSADLWLVVGDATQLHQVVLNLSVNARDAMPLGGKLKLRARNVMLDESFTSMLPGATPGPNVLLEVEDSGGGIPPEIVERIFDPFFTTKGIGKGTGLGLSTVIGIVKSHGGHIGVKSEVGVGTTFQVYLPAAAGDSPAAHASQSSAEIPIGHGECILVVDDEEHVRRSVRFALEVHGYTVMEAFDGTDALAIFAQNTDQIALVLTDLMMPYMDGVALVHALRRIKPEIPIIASTGLGRKRQLAELERMNIQAMLTKPYGNDVLLNSVHAALTAPA